MRKGWTTVASLIFACSRKDDRTLIVYLTPEQGMLDAWRVMAIETVRLGEGVGPQQVLNDHAHEDQGTVRGLTDAMAVAERYAKKWQRRSIAIDPCACEDMAKTG